MNFLDIASREDAEFVGPAVTIVSCNEVKKREIGIVPGESDAGYGEVREGESAVRLVRGGFLLEARPLEEGGGQEG